MYLLLIHTQLFKLCQHSMGKYTSNKIKNLFNKQKRAARIFFNEDKLTHARPLLKKLNALNVYQINIFQILILMYKVKNNSTPKAITKLFHRIQNKYNTKLYLPTISLFPKLYQRLLTLLSRIEDPDSGTNYSVQLRNRLTLHIYLKQLSKHYY